MQGQGGEVAQFAGDTVLAVFAQPAAAGLRTGIGLARGPVLIGTAGWR